MKRAALGIRMHSGWGMLVAVSGDADSLEILDRRRIVITDAAIPAPTRVITTQPASDLQPPSVMLRAVQSSQSAWL